MLRAIRNDPIFILLVVGFLSVRLLVLLSAPHALYDGEESYNGTSAKEMLRGLKLPFGEYQHFVHEGGALVMSILCVPFFAMLGTNFVAMKLPSLALSFATFVLWYAFAQRFIGRRTAHYLGVLYVFAPPLILKTDLMIWGHHNNINFFIAAAAFALFCCLSNAEKPSRQDRYVAVLGLICGFGMFFNYMFIAMLAACLCRLLLMRNVRFRQICWFVLFFAIGFSPWLGLRLCYGTIDPGLGDRVSGWHFTDGYLLMILKDRFFERLPVSPCFPAVTGLPEFALSYAYSGLLLTGIVFSVFKAVGARTPDQKADPDGKPNPGQANTEIPTARQVELADRHASATEHHCRCAKTAARFAWLFCLLLVGITAVSPFASSMQWHLAHWIKQYRYDLPLYPFVFLLVAIVLAGKHRDWWQVVPRLMLVISICSLGTYGIIRTVNWLQIGSSLSFRGYSYETFGARLFGKYIDQPSRAVAIGDMIDPQFRDDYFRGVGWYFASEQRRPGFADLALFASWERKVPEEYLPYLYEGFATELVIYGPSIRWIDQFAATIEERYRPSFCRGVGWGIAYVYRYDLKKALPFMEELRCENRMDAYFGFGRVAGSMQLFGREVPDDFSELAPPFQVSITKGKRFAERLYASGRLNFCDFIEVDGIIRL